MGIPIKLVAVVNPNDIVHRTFKSGDLSLAKDVKATWASAMDIQVRYYCNSVIRIFFSIHILFIYLYDADSIQCGEDFIDGC